MKLTSILVAHFPFGFVVGWPVPSPEDVAPAAVAPATFAPAAVASATAVVAVTKSKSPLFDSALLEQRPTNTLFKRARGAQTPEPKPEPEPEPEPESRRPGEPHVTWSNDDFTQKYRDTPGMYRKTGFNPEFWYNHVCKRVGFLGCKRAVLKMAPEKNLDGDIVPGYHHAQVDVWPKHEGARTVQIYPNGRVNATPEWWELPGQVIKAKTYLSREVPKKWEETRDWMTGRMWDAVDVATGPLIRYAEEQARQRRLEG